MSDTQTPMEYLQSRVKDMLKEHARFIMRLKGMSDEDKQAEWAAIENLYRYVEDYDANMGCLEACKEQYYANLRAAAEEKSKGEER